MRALTLWQPWASLVALREKRVETRCWQTKYRGDLAIHAAAKLPPRWLGSSRHTNEFDSELAAALKCGRDNLHTAERALPYGAVLCIVKLVDCIETPIFAEHAEWLSRRELIFGNYEDGRYAWLLEMVEVFDRPIPAKGNRLLWSWSRCGHD